GPVARACGVVQGACAEPRRRAGRRGDRRLPRPAEAMGPAGAVPAPPRLGWRPIMICVPPARFEFGLKVRYHVPAVFALPRPVVVCIEPGEEALYPQATHIVVDPREDVHRKDLYSRDAAYVQQWTNELLRRY